MSTLRVTTLTTPAGVEVYTAKAWVNFNGTGTVAIRASGNVSSITDNGVGTYRINFNSAFSDSNFSVSFGLANGNTTNPTNAGIAAGASGMTTTYVNIITSEGADSRQDYAVVCVQVFR